MMAGDLNHERSCIESLTCDHDQVLRDMLAPIKDLSDAAAVASYTEEFYIKYAPLLFFYL